MIVIAFIIIFFLIIMQVLVRDWQCTMTSDAKVSITMEQSYYEDVYYFDAHLQFTQT